MGTRGPTWYRFGNVLLSRKSENIVRRKRSIFPQLWQGAKHEQSSSIAELIREFSKFYVQKSVIVKRTFVNCLSLQF